MIKSIIGLVLLAVLWSCSQGPETQGDKKGILVSIGPQAWFVHQLLPDTVPVYVLVPPGSSPHAFEPGPADLIHLEQSLGYLRIGHIGFELSLAEKIRSSYPDKPVFDLSQGISLMQGHEHHHEGEHHEHGGEGTDPHIWMSVTQGKIIAANTRDALLQLFPDQQDSILSRFARLSTRLDSLDLQFAEQLKASGVGRFAIFHPALSYYAKDYGLEQLSIEEEGKDPSPAHLQQVIDLIREGGIKTILVQREFNQEQARTIAREAGVGITVIDPLSEDWERSLREITAAIAVD